jgi:hypothetical protein
MNLAEKGFKHIERGELAEAETVLTGAAQKIPAKRSTFVGASKNLREMAEDNLKTLPPAK